jgi:hypothetical protein
MPRSKKLWLQAAKKEEQIFPNEPRKKKELINRALEFLPDDVQIWKEAVALEETEDGAK